MKKQILYLFVTICIVVVMLSCSKEDGVRPIEDRTVLVYIAADNSLSQEGSDNIALMMSGIKSFSGNWVVYWDDLNAAPCLLHIYYEHGKAVKKVIATYPEENSASPEVLARVVSDTKHLFPADSYGLILWSHGMGWLPRDFYFSGAYDSRQRGIPPKTKYFTEDKHPGEGRGAGYMDIKDLGRALPRGFEFILFDACLMSSVETLYELKDKCEYIIASPAEILAAGFPYDRIMPLLEGGEEELKQVCREYYDYYNQGKWPYATVALIKAPELESLARVAREALAGRAGEIALADVSDVWCYPRIASGVPRVFYDLGEYMKKTATDVQWAAFRSQLDKTVIFKLATPVFYQDLIPAEKYSGLSVYIPLQKWSGMNSYYFSLDWVKSVY